MSAAPTGQAPNQASLVNQTVAGVQFGTLPGFNIERVNPPDKTDSYVVVTFDSQGRLVVSKEQDFPRIMLDADKDGVYEGEKILSDKVRNCQGLWFDGPTMWGSCVLVEAAAELAAKAPPAPAGWTRRWWRWWRRQPPGRDRPPAGHQRRRRDGHAGNGGHGGQHR